MELYFKMVRESGNPVALFDLDETLGDMVPGMIAYVNETHGTNIEYQKVKGLIDFKRELNVDFQEWLQLINKKSMDDFFSFYPNVATFLMNIINGTALGVPHDVAIVTSRGNYWKNSVGLTIEQLQRNLIPYQSLAILDFHTDKIAWAREQFGDRLTTVFEDSPSNLIKARAAGLRTYKNITPYNKYVETCGYFKASSGIIRLYDENSQDSSHRFQRRSSDM